MEKPKRIGRWVRIETDDGEAWVAPHLVAALRTPMRGDEDETDLYLAGIDEPVRLGMCPEAAAEILAEV